MNKKWSSYLEGIRHDSAVLVAEVLWEQGRHYPQVQSVQHEQVVPDGQPGEVNATGKFPVIALQHNEQRQRVAQKSDYDEYGRVVHVEAHRHLVESLRLCHGDHVVVVTISFSRVETPSEDRKIVVSDVHRVVIACGVHCSGEMNGVIPLHLGDSSRH